MITKKITYVGLATTILVSSVFAKDIVNPLNKNFLSISPINEPIQEETLLKFPENRKMIENAICKIFKIIKGEEILTIFQIKIDEDLIFPIGYLKNSFEDQLKKLDNALNNGVKPIINIKQTDLGTWIIEDIKWSEKGKTTILKFEKPEVAEIAIKYR